MLQLHAVPGQAARASPRLSHSRILQLDLRAAPALLALEVGALHLGVDLAGADDDSVQADQSSYVGGVEILDQHAVAVVQVLESEHELRLLGELLAPADLVGLSLDEVVLVDVLEHMVEARDHLRRIIHELHVDVPVRFVEVPPVHLEHRLLRVLHLDDAVTIDALAGRHLIHHHLRLEVDDEVLQPLHRGLDVDVGAVDLVVLQRLVCDLLGLVDLERGFGEGRVLGD